MGKEAIISALRKLRASTFKNKTAQLRDLFDEIEALKNDGFSHARIVETLKNEGLDFDLKTFEVTFYRVKKEREMAPTRKESIPTKENIPMSPIAIEATITKPLARTAIIPVVKAVSQEELKNIARGDFDPNQFLDE